MEASERRGRLVAIAAILFIIFWSQCKGVEGHRNTTKMLYVCPKQFIRLGHSCYYFSEEVNTWHKAVFKCIDLNSTLTVPARWEDRNLRNYLNKNNFDKQIRWIGGIYDYSSKMWKWGGALKIMRYQSFSKMKKMSPEQLQWHCIAMMPELLYRWAPRQCTEERQYICQTKLRKIPKSEYMKRQREMNAITVPSASREVNRIQNDVTPDPRLSRREPPPPGQLRYWTRYPPSAKSYHYMVKKRSKPSARPQSKLRKLFPGYKWNRHNPEASYRYNAELLRSGKTGLSKQKVNGLIARLKHMRDVQLAKRKRSNGDWLINETRPKLVRTNARTYTMDNNISALHPKTIVEEIDLPPPPPPAVVVPRPARTAW